MRLSSIQKAISTRLGAILVLLLVAQCSQPAHAQSAAADRLTVVGKPLYESDGHKALSVVIREGGNANPHKGAAIILEYEKSDEHYRFNGTYGKQVIAFVTAANWRKFALMWRKARAAHAKAEDEYFGKGTEYYFDGDTVLGIGKGSDGEVIFTMAGNPDARNTPQDINMFYLSPKDLAAFDAIVGKVSFYFGK